MADSRAVGTITVSFLGGPYDGHRGALTATPARVVIAGHEYHAITDPDTGVFLGAYAYMTEEPPR